MRGSCFNPLEELTQFSIVLSDENYHPHTLTPTQAARKAQEEAELQQVREQAKFQEEMNRRQLMEDELRAANQHRTPSPSPDTGDTGTQLERLQKIEQKQKTEIQRLVCYSYNMPIRAV